MTTKTSHTSWFSMQIKVENEREYKQIKHLNRKLKKLVVLVILGPGIKELEHTTQPLYKMTSFTSLAVFPTPEGPSSRLRRKGNNCHNSIAG